MLKYLSMNTRTVYNIYIYIYNVYMYDMTNVESRGDGCDPDKLFNPS